MAVTRSRSAALDAVRVIAIAAMVFADAQVAGGVLLFLAGWLWKPLRPIREEWRSRLRSVLVPAGCWLLVAGAGWIVLLMLAGSRGGVGRIEVGPGGVGPGGLGRVAYFGLVVAFVGLCLVRRLLDRFGDGAPAVVLVVWLGSYLVGWWLVDVPELIGTGAAALLLLAAGERARAWSASLPRPALTGLALTAGSLVLVGAGLVAPVDPARAVPGTPIIGTLVLVAISWGSLLLVDDGVRRLAPMVRLTRVAAGLAALATVAVPVLLGQAVLLFVLGARAEGRLFAPALGLISWVVALLLARSPLSRYLVGEHPVPARPALRIVRPGETAPRPTSHLTVVRIPQPRSPVADRRFS